MRMPSALAQHRHGTHDGQVGALAGQALDEGAVDLELVQRKALEVVHRRVAGAEVVDGDRAPSSRKRASCSLTVSVRSMSTPSVSSSTRPPRTAGVRLQQLRHLVAQAPGRELLARDVHRHLHPRLAGTGPSA
jgi:hypothetical protein